MSGVLALSSTTTTSALVAKATPSRAIFLDLVEGFASGAETGHVGGVGPPALGFMVIPDSDFAHDFLSISL